MSEYWIHQDGNTDFADGDVGDYNHEAIVIQNVQRGIIGNCEQIFDIYRKSSFSDYKRSFADDEWIAWDEFKEELAKAYAADYTQRNPQKSKIIKSYLQNDPDKLVLFAIREAGVKKAEWACAESVGDAREYAMQYWGWKTYRDGHIDTWRIARPDLQAIIYGIETIADEKGWSDKRLSRIGFTITVFSNQKHFSLTLDQMKRWLEKPASVPQANYQRNYDYLTPQADKQIRNIEISKMHPAYTGQDPNRSVSSYVNPFGDSVLSFKSFLN